MERHEFSSRQPSGANHGVQTREATRSNNGLAKARRSMMQMAEELGLHITPHT